MSRPLGRVQRVDRPRRPDRAGRRRLEPGGDGLDSRSHRAPAGRAAQADSPAARAAADILGIGGEDFGCAGADGCGALRQSALVLDGGRRPWRAATRQRGARRARRLSIVLLRLALHRPSAPDRRDGSSRRGHDSPDGFDFGSLRARRWLAHRRRHRPTRPRAISRPVGSRTRHRVAALEPALDRR